MEVKDKEKIGTELKEIVGAEHVSTATADLYYYSQDMTEHEPSWPDFVVMPDSVEEVQDVLRLANREKIAVIPYTSGANVGGLTIPSRGGMVLDLGRMNRLIEVNEEDRYIIVEPGFNFGDLRRLLDKEYPHLWYNFPGAPPSSSVMSNALLDGFGYAANQLGTNHDGTNGLEVVLPTGEVVRLGSCSVSPYWFARAPLPDLAGLFFSWQGGTGIVTKIAVQLWPRHPLKQLKTLVTTGIQPTFRFIHKLGQTRVCERCGALPFDLAQASEEQGVWLQQTANKNPGVSLKEDRTSGTYDRPPGPDKFGVTLIVEADTEDELKAKMAVVDAYIKEELKDTGYDEHPAQFVDMSDVPMRGGTESVGGLTWIGSLGPTSQWAKALEKALPIFDKYRLMRIVACACFRGAHYGMFRSIIGFNKSDPEEVTRVNKCIRELLLVTLDNGFIPYKAPRWAIEEMVRRGDPNWVMLMKRVKNMLDPNNIMNPGRFGDIGD